MGRRRRGGGKGCSYLVKMVVRAALRASELAGAATRIAVDAALGQRVEKDQLLAVEAHELLPPDASQE